MESDWAAANWAMEDEDMDEGARVDSALIAKSVKVPQAGVGARMRSPEVSSMPPVPADLGRVASTASSSYEPPSPMQLNQLHRMPVAQASQQQTPYVQPQAVPHQQEAAMWAPAGAQPGSEQRPSYTPPPVAQRAPSYPSYTPQQVDLPSQVEQRPSYTPPVASLDQRQAYPPMQQMLPGAWQMAHAAQHFAMQQPGAYFSAMPMHSMQLHGGGAPAGLVTGPGAPLPAVAPAHQQLSITTRPDQVPQPMPTRGAPMPQAAVGPYGPMPPQQFQQPLPLQPGMPPFHPQLSGHFGGSGPLGLPGVAQPLPPGRVWQQPPPPLGQAPALAQQGQALPPQGQGNGAWPAGQSQSGAKEPRGLGDVAGPWPPQEMAAAG